MNKVISLSYDLTGLVSQPERAAQHPRSLMNFIHLVKFSSRSSRWCR